MDKAVMVMDTICELLPKTNEYRIWSDGEDILVENEQLAEHIADFIDAIYGEKVCATGYYDPEVDGEMGCVNDHTGFYYVHID